MTVPVTPPLLTTGETCRLITAIERDCEVNRLLYKGLHVWPLIRRLLWRHLAKPKIQKSTVEKSATVTKDPPSQLKRYYLPEKEELDHSEFLITRDEVLDSLPEKPVDLLFFSHASDHTAFVDGKAYSPLIDPLIDLVEDTASCVKLEMHMSGPRHVPDSVRAQETRFVSPLPFVDHQFLGKIKETVYSLPADELIEDLWCFADAFGAYGIDIKISPRHLCAQILRIQEMACFFLSLLEKLQPKVVLAARVQGDIVFGLCVACKQLGIPFVEVLHGAVGETDAKCKHWTAVPKDGYALLPDAYWCWDDKSAREFFRYCTPNEQRRALYGGNLWLSMWQAESDRLFTREMYEFQEMTEGYSKVILYSHHPLMGVIPDNLIEVMQGAPQDWLWLIRDHPHSKSETSYLVDQLRDAGLDNCDVEKATSLPLPLLLKVSHCHVTCASSVIVEAEYFGVPSAIIHPISREFYSDDIECKRFTYAPTVHEITSFLEEARPASKRAKTVDAAVKEQIHARSLLLKLAGCDQTCETL